MLSFRTSEPELQVGARQLRAENYSTMQERLACTASLSELSGKSNLRASPSAEAPALAKPIMATPLSIPGMLYWTSGLAPADESWDPFDPSRGLTRPSPVGIPGFADTNDVRAAIADFGKTGFHGPLNYYRAIDPFFTMVGAFAGATIRQPSFFMIGAVDGLTKVRPITEKALRPGLPDLRGFVTLSGVGHWPQLEATDAVNEALLGFLTETR